MRFNLFLRISLLIEILLNILFVIDMLLNVTVFNALLLIVIPVDYITTLAFIYLLMPIVIIIGTLKDKWCIKTNFIVNITLFIIETIFSLGAIVMYIFIHTEGGEYYYIWYFLVSMVITLVTAIWSFHKSR